MDARRVGFVSALGLVATAVALWFALAVPSAPAGNRDPLSTLEAFPGLTQVTLGKSFAGTASLENRQSSTFTDVKFRLPLPAGATLTATDCPQYEIQPGSPAQFVCLWGHQLRAGETANVAFVLLTPSSGSSLALAGEWSIKEGKQVKGGGPDFFPTNTLSVPLLSGTNAQQAGGFATTACTSPSTPTLATNQALGSGNPLSTSICAPNLPVLPVAGIVAVISESNRVPADPGVTQVSDICLPAAGFGCGTTPFVFSPLATFTFRIDNTQLPLVCTNGGDDDDDDDCKLFKITKFFHDGQLVSTSPTADPRVVSITFNSITKITTVVVSSSVNGRWNGG